MSTTARFSAADFCDLLAAGSFLNVDGKRLELMFGEVRESPVLSPTQEELIDRLNDWAMYDVPEEQARIRASSSIVAPKLESVPDVDVCLVRPKKYLRTLPRNTDVLLAIEVADERTLDADRREKGRLFALAGIQEYWIVNIPDKCIEINRYPQEGYYPRLTTLRRGAAAAPLAFPAAKLEVAELFEEIW